MDMAAKFHEQLVFHVTGKRAGDGLAPIDVGALRPALLARYRDLTRLRYDFPLVLPEPTADAEYVHSLASIVDEVLSEMAPRGIEGERLRKHVLRVERELRVLLAEGATGALSELWAAAVERLGRGADETVVKVLAQAGETMTIDGEVVDCDPRLPARFVTQAWRYAQALKARAFRALVDTLIRKLSDILPCGVHPLGGRPAAGSAAASIGSAHADVFDFAVMSRLVARTAPKDELPAPAPPPHRMGARGAPHAAVLSGSRGRRHGNSLRVRVRQLRSRRRGVPGTAATSRRGREGDLRSPSSRPTVRTSRPTTTRSSSATTRTR